MQGEAASAEGEAAAGSPELAEIIREGGYTEQQISSVGETASYRKKMHVGLSSPERRSQCLASELPRTGPLLLGANTAADFKWKSELRDHSENPRALKNVANSLPVLHNGAAKPG